MDNMDLDSLSVVVAFLTQVNDSSRDRETRDFYGKSLLKKIVEENGAKFISHKITQRHNNGRGRSTSYYRNIGETPEQEEEKFQQEIIFNECIIKKLIK